MVLITLMFLSTPFNVMASLPERSYQVPSQSTTATTTQITSISTGKDNTCVITTSGGVKCWGIGYFEPHNGPTPNYYTPTNVPSLTKNVTDVSLGSYHSCVLLATTNVKCWGSNFHGQLGIGNGTTISTTTPVDVSGLPNGAKATALGFGHTCALTTAGGVKCWGNNDFGQLGNGASQSNSLTPVDVSGLTSGIVSISAGDYHTCALNTVGGVKCWGYNYAGQVGSGVSQEQYRTPVTVSGLTGGVMSISAESNHTCALTNAGAVMCWGDNYDGQLGNGTLQSNYLAPVTVLGLTSGVISISAGANHTCALTNTKGIKCWGSNSAGQLGSGTSQERHRTPVNVSGLTSGVSNISAGSQHTCALTTARAVKCWGSNSAGQLGNGTTNNSNVPITVADLEAFSRPIELPASAPASNDRTFVGSLMLPSEKASERKIIVPVDRYFAGAGDRPSKLAVQVRLRSNTGGKVQILLNGMLIGSVSVRQSWDAPTVLYTFNNSGLLNTLLKTAILQADPLPPIPGNNTITLIGPDDLQVSWASINISGDLRPVLFVYGWTGGEGTFAGFSNWLTSKKQIANVNSSDTDLFRGIEHTNTTIAALYNKVAAVKKRFGVDKVNIIAHSRGGVISRLGLGTTQPGILKGQIDSLVTISSPHHGTYFIGQLAEGNCRSLGNVNIIDAERKCFLIAYQLQIDSMRLINYGLACSYKVLGQTVPKQVPGGAWTDCHEQFSAQTALASTEVNFRSISGEFHTADVGTMTATYPWLNSCATAPEANTVNIDQSYNLTHLNINEHNDVLLKAISLIQAGRVFKPPYHCPRPSALSQSTDSEVNPAAVSSPDISIQESQFVAHFTDNIASSATKEQRFLVSPGDDLTIMGMATSELSVTLRTPDGKTLTPSSHLGKSADAYTSIFAIPNATSGSWVLHLKNNGTKEARYSVSVQAQSRIQLQATTESLVAAKGSGIVVHAAVLSDTTPLVSGLTITAKADGNNTLYTLYDDGTHGDTKARDGIFSAQLPGFSTATYQGIVVQAKWSGGQRQQTLVVNVRDRLAQITTVGADIPGDTNGDGRWEELSFPVEIQSQYAGIVKLSAALQSANGTNVGGVEQLVSVVAGTQTVMLAIDGQHIHDAQQDGPYTLTQLSLEGTLNDALTSDSSSVTVKTQPYSWKQFVGTSIRLTSTDSHYTSAAKGETVNITFNATVGVDVSGTYAYKGDLYTSDGMLVASGVTSTKEVTNQANITFSFLGIPVKNTGLKPPYELRNVSVWLVDSQTVSSFGIHEPFATVGHTLSLPVVVR
jgi:alpha-tubulin suppressor-like RCC1 family protein/pimeloyl-ACP methyl ester carboxylesterase